MPLQADDIVDITKTTLRELGRMKWSQISTTLQNYVAMSNLLRKEKRTIDSGYGIQWNVQVTQTGAATRTGLFANETPNNVDTMQTANIPWRHAQTNYSVDRRQVAMNRSPAKIVDYIATQRVASLVSLAEILEVDFWTKPVDSTDTSKAFGLPYWVVKNNTTGFNGGNPSGFTSGAGNLSSTTYSTWKNFTGQYTLVSNDDLIRLWRTAATKTNFKPPVANPSYGGSPRYGYYMNYDVYGRLVEVAQSNNDRLGPELAMFQNTFTFMGTNCTWVPYLDSDTNDPVFGIDWEQFSPVCLEGEYMTETPVPPDRYQPTVTTVYTHLTYNYRCTNRRCNFVLALNT
jgi:hypothetical protein